MRKRKLGSTGLETAPLVFGGVVFGWTVDEPTAFQILDAFVEAGFNTIDTADIYPWLPERPGNQGGGSETILGRWMKARANRASVLIATKVGMPFSPNRTGLSRAYVRRAVEDSLRRLQTDYIDLYQAHRDDLSTPLEETLDAFRELICEGKVRAIGASNYTAERMIEAQKVSRECGLPAYGTLQPLYNLCDRADYEQNLKPVVLEQGIGVIPSVSLASGFLTGKYRCEADLRQSCRAGSVKRYMNVRGYRILAALDDVARSHHATPAGVALAWLIARPRITAPIAAATTPEQLHRLIEGTRLRLDPAAIEILNRASANV